MKRIPSIVAAFLLVAGLQACAPRQADHLSLQPSIEQVGFVVISDSIHGDPEMDAFVAPYRARLDELITRVIGTAGRSIEKAQPEGRLGNMAADAMLKVTHEYTNEPIDFAITNNGGLRIPIPEGEVTVGLIYELMPFENTNVILTLTAEQVQQVADELAAFGGEPVSGLELVITDDGRAEDVLVRGQPLVSDRTYRVVTSNYLAFGGGDMPTLWEAVEVEGTPLLLRDSIIEYIERRTAAGEEINPQLEGRVRR